MKAISFLGVTNYMETTYVHASGECRTRLFPVALCQFLRPTELLVMVTEQARAKWFDILVAELRPSGIVPKPVVIPEGHSIDDLWTIFAQLTEHLQEEEQVLFDITYSFRTLPFLTFLAASYLRVVKRVNLKGVYYGAWEARQPLSQPPLPTDRSPIFDLSPFMNLLALTTSTDQFLKTGNAEALAKLLPPDGPTGPLAASVAGIAQGLHLLRPMDVMQESAALPGRIDAAIPTVSTTMPPFAPLIQRVNAEYGTFGLVDPTNYTINSKAALVRQLRMAEWYTDKGQFVHALSMAREWLPSLLCWHFGLDPMVETNRSEMEFLLTRGGRSEDSTTGTVKESEYRDRWKALAGQRRLARLWNEPGKLSGLRNDVLHSGFRKNPRTAQAIAEDTQRVIEELKAIAAEWKLEE